MRKICIINRKGGVGKTTTAVSLAAGLARQDKKVLLVDLDPQSSVHVALKVESEHSIHQAVKGQANIDQCIANVAANFDVITSSDSLVDVEYMLSNNKLKELVLAQTLDKIEGYDYIILDCPPSMGMINQNVIAYCDEAFVPATTDYMGYDSLSKMLETIEKAKEHFGSEIKVTKIIPTLFDRRNNICKEMLVQMQADYPELTGYPVRINSKLKEAPQHGKSIFAYAKSSSGAKDYGRLVEDVIAMES